VKHIFTASILLGLLCGCGPSPSQTPVSLVSVTATPTSEPSAAFVSSPVVLSRPTSTPSVAEYVPYEDDVTRALKRKARMSHKDVAVHSAYADRMKQRASEVKEVEDRYGGSGLETMKVQSKEIDGLIGALDAESNKFKCWYELGCYLDKGNKDRVQAIKFLQMASLEGGSYPPARAARKKLKAMGVTPQEKYVEE
jgi:hypothetical protein